MASAEAIWPRSTALPSRISAVVVSKLALAVWMNEVPVSRIRCRSGPVPAKASPSWWAVVRREPRCTDSTVFEMSPSSFCVGSGVRVSSVAICEPLWR